ncbi:winged helix-turn-helix domain-containing protein [Phaeobacter inhibens]|uniref:winged helix-turn-helix domain-containing protein n=1 Tax=Phaeobacter inhibens TaxID=221822 RepID=UPI000C9A1561|nr:winged helix-turn-helix domain-containing protein [Phaeobacter inhibens]AUQ53191.1 hypothetical protein PhaeoP92_00485 [Phaeobacter inhibens]AUQ77207.1 hypothetical protein PhaeoP74_00486 [Phaeobacter inhibens]AUR14366.1 hypothetical protein PhaeoP70_00484 [Phaeobacter inhibens]
MTTGASKLDTDKLRKVRELMDRGATDGEQAAAKAKAERLASDAGMTLAQALSTLDTAPSGPTVRDLFAGFDDWMESREPGYKARAAAERAEKERKRLTRCQELLRQYGSEDAVFAPTMTEEAIREALAHMADPDTLWGYRDFSGGKLTPDMWEAVRGAVRVPETVQEAWAAYQEQEARQDDRCAFFPDYSPHPWADVWRDALEHLLDNLRTPTADGVAARLEWMGFLANREFSRDAYRDQQLHAALQEDFTALMASVQTGHRSTSDKSARVRTLLQSEPDLSDREIARRAEVSPQTVGNWRRRLAAKGWGSLEE